MLEGALIARYDRAKPLTEKQRTYLDALDCKMDAGLHVGGQFIAAPDRLQRAQSIALMLIQALEQHQEAIVAAASSYLAIRLPDLKQVHAVRRQEGIMVDLVFDRPYAQESKIEFIQRRR